MPLADELRKPGAAWAVAAASSVAVPLLPAPAACVSAAIGAAATMRAVSLRDSDRAAPLSSPARLAIAGAAVGIVAALLFHLYRDNSR